MRGLPWLVLLVACASKGATDSTPSTSTVPGDPTGLPVGSPTGDLGYVGWWVGDLGGGPVEQALLAVFAPHFEGVAAPLICGLKGQLCVATLPEALDQRTPWSESTFDPLDPSMVWVGDAIDVGGFQLPFRVDPETGWAGYAASVPGTAQPRLDVTLGGAWGDWSAPGVVPVVGKIEGLVPDAGSYLDASTSLDLRWAPSTDPDDTLYVVVEAPAERALWRVDDDGAWSVPNAQLPALSPGELWTVSLVRRVGTEPVRDGGPEVVIGEGWSTASWVAGAGPARFSCQSILGGDPGATSGVYAVRPDVNGPSFDVWCDMSTDGGGWTLVASSAERTFDDQAAAWSEGLTTQLPTQPMAGVWDGLRPAVPGSSDVRFTCKKVAGDAVMSVDLSFYDVPWYREITAGPDLQSCFNDSNGGGADPPPARRDNLTGTSLPAGDPWAAGYLEGEDDCGDTGDFTVDFDDRGMDGNQLDGTDWGEDDTLQKCGDASIANGGAWFLWVR